MHDTQALERSETSDVISSDKVDGTAIYGQDGEHLGSVHHLMIGKRDGQVRHAVISYGGFLGLGEDYFPLPWHELTYDETRGGYTIIRSADQLKDAPRFKRDQEPVWDRSFDEQLTGFYARR